MTATAKIPEIIQKLDQIYAESQTPVGLTISIAENTRWSVQIGDLVKEVGTPAKVLAWCDAALGDTAASIDLEKQERLARIQARVLRDQTIIAALEAELGV